MSQEVFEYLEPDQVARSYLVRDVWPTANQADICFVPVNWHKAVWFDQRPLSHTCRTAVDRRLDFLHQYKSFTSTQISEALSANTCWGSVQVPQSQYLTVLYILFAVKQFSSRKPPCRGGNLRIELPSYMHISIHYQQIFFSRCTRSWWQKKKFYSLG